MKRVFALLQIDFVCLLSRQSLIIIVSALSHFPAFATKRNQTKRKKKKESFWRRSVISMQIEGSPLLDAGRDEIEVTAFISQLEIS